MDGCLGWTDKIDRDEALQVAPEDFHQAQHLASLVIPEGLEPPT